VTADDRGAWTVRTVVRTRRVSADRHVLICDDGWEGTLDASASDAIASRSALDAVLRYGTVRVLGDGDRVRGLGHAAPRVHPHTRSIMEMLEIDVEAAVEWAAGPVLWRDGKVEKDLVSDFRYMLTDEGELVLSTAIKGRDGTMATLNWNTLVLSVELPETAVIAMTGRTLRDCVSIPPLDHLEVTVLRAYNENLRTRLEIIPPHGAEPLA